MRELPGADLEADAARDARVWDAIVVGAGPAGCVAAFGLARAGLRTLLLDKARFPRAKPCGCCLNGAALGTLRAIGLADELAALGPRPLRSLRLWTSGVGAEIPLPHSAALSREALDSALARNAVRAGSTFVQEAVVESSTLDGEVRRVHVRRRDERLAPAARLVIAADGLSGRLLAQEPSVTIRPASDARVGVFGRLADAERRLDDGVIHMACGAGGYVGGVRLEDGSVNLAAALDAGWIRASRGMERATQRLWGDAGLPPLRGWLEARWSGTPALTRRVAPPGGRRLLAVGDASGYVEPFTGEGMAWGVMAAAKLVAIAVQAAEHWDDRWVDAWAQAQRALLARRRRRCRWIARGLRNGLVRRAGVEVLRRWPGLAARYVNALDALDEAPPWPAKAAAASGAA